MKSRPFMLVLVYVAFGILAGLTHAWAGPWLPAPGEYSSEFRTSYANANSLFGDDHEQRRLPQGGFVEERQILSINEVGWKDRVSFRFDVPLRSITARVPEPPFTRTVTGLGDLLLGLRWRILDGATALAFEGNWKAPLGYEHTGFPLLGAGQQDVGGALFFGTAIGNVGFAQLAGGYLYRFEDPLDEITYAADAGFWLGDSWLAALRYQGFTGIGAKDSLDVEANLQALGPRVVYRLDDRMDMFAGADLPIAGRNVFRTFEYYVGVTVKHTRLNRLQGFLGGKRRP